MLPLYDQLIFREAILQGDNSVERICILGVLAEISDADELESLARSGCFKAGLDHRALDLGE